MVTMAANNCLTDRQNNTGLMLLCEVALGEVDERIEPEQYSRNLAPGKLSIRGVGSYCHRGYAYHDGVQIPTGKPYIQNDYPLLYSEYVVFDVCQIKLKYLVRLKFDYK